MGRSGIWHSRIARLLLTDLWVVERTLIAEVYVHSVLAGAYGVWVLINPVSMSSQIYAPILTPMPENNWAVLFFVVGALGLASVEINNYRLRRAALLLTMTAWVFLTVNALVRLSTAPGTIVIIGKALLAAWAYVKLARPSTQGGSHGGSAVGKL